MASASAPEDLGPEVSVRARALPTSPPVSDLTVSPTFPSLQVRRQDQEQINEFGRGNMRRSELRDDLAEVDKRVLELGDAEEMVMLADADDEGGGAGGAVKLMVGECFVDATGDEATAWVQRELATAQERKKALEAEMKAVEARLGALKKALYARFGKNINLEE